MCVCVVQIWWWWWWGGCMITVFGLLLYLLRVWFGGSFFRFGLVWFLVLFGKSQKTNSFITISFCNTTFSSSYSMKLSKLFCYFKPWNWPGTKNKVEKMRKMQKKALISEHFSFFICCIFLMVFFVFFLVRIRICGRLVGGMLKWERRNGKE